jgi:acetyl-CoA carboxylase / biotin carboxylase 1
MEAKGCAKPATWKTARRHFYWAVRARVAQSTALAALAESAPDTTQEYRLKLLNNLASLEPSSSLQEIAEKLEDLDLSQTMVKLKADHLARNLIELAKEDRKATMDGLIRLVDNLSDEDRASLLSALQSAGSGGPPSYAN